MERRQRLFIYDRKELGVLILLGLMVAIFAFTLGVHLGKHVSTQAEVTPDKAASHPVETLDDTLPNRQQLAEEARTAAEEGESTLDEATQEELTESGIQMDPPKPVELPKEAASPNQGATTLKEKEAPVTAQESLHPALDRKAPAGRYTLQVGSYQSLEDAAKKISELEKAELLPYMRAVILRGKGQWYRIYAGGFKSVEDAQKEGKRLQSQNLVDGFIVSNRVE